MKKVKRKSIYKAYKQKQTAFNHHYLQCRKKIEVEEIHQLRVQIKRLRVILNLAEFVTDGKFKKKKHYIFFKKVFKSAGKVREYQVSLELLEKYPVNQAITKFNSQLNAEMLIAEKKFLMVLRKFNKKALSKRNSVLKNRLKRIKKNSITDPLKKYISDQQRLIHKRLDKFYSNQDIHGLRKHMKELSPVIMILLEINKEKKIQKLLEEFKRSEDLLGTWHDKEVLVVQLEEYTKTLADNPHKRRLIFLMDHIVEENSISLKLIRSSVRSNMQQMQLILSA